MSSSVISYLASLDWPSLQVLFGIGYCKKDVDDTLYMANEICQEALMLLHTRCLFSTNLAAHLLNSRDNWKAIDLNDINLNTVKAINIEIDVTSRLDHMFVLANIDGKWYIIQSYVTKYTTIIEPINIEEFLSTIRKWRMNGVNPLEWKKYFHANMPSMNRALPHIYAVDKIYTNDIQNNVNAIVNTVNTLYKDKNSYIHDDTYKCIMSKYIH